MVFADCLSLAWFVGLPDIKWLQLFSPDPKNLIGVVEVQISGDYYWAVLDTEILKRRADRRWNQLRNMNATKRGHRPKRSWRGSLLTTHSRGSAQRSHKKRDECWKLRQLPLRYFEFKNISRSKEGLWIDCMIIGIYGSWGFRQTALRRLAKGGRPSRPPTKEGCQDQTRSKLFCLRAVFSHAQSHLLHWKQVQFLFCR